MQLAVMVSIVGMVLYVVRQVDTLHDNTVPVTPIPHSWSSPTDTTYCG